MLSIEEIVRITRLLDFDYGGKMVTQLRIVTDQGKK
jgi:hypothetical protein